MELRSWMAAILLTAGMMSVPLAGASAQSPARKPDSTAAPTSPGTSKQDSGPAGTKSQDGNIHQVKLKLVIAGPGRDGCDVEVKPGNRSCRFQAQTQHVGSRGEVSFLFKDVEVGPTDRNCTFAITVREAGRDSKTIYRGFRLPAMASSTSSVVQTFKCYMNSPSRLADLDRTDRTRR